MRDPHSQHPVEGRETETRTCNQLEREREREWKGGWDDEGGHRCVSKWERNPTFGRDLNVRWCLWKREDLLLIFLYQEKCREENRGEEEHHFNLMIVCPTSFFFLLLNYYTENLKFFPYNNQNERHNHSFFLFLPFNFLEWGRRNQRKKKNKRKLRVFTPSSFHSLFSLIIWKVVKDTNTKVDGSGVDREVSCSFSCPSQNLHFFHIINMEIFHKKK